MNADVPKKRVNDINEMFWEGVEPDLDNMNEIFEQQDAEALISSPEEGTNK